MRKFLLMISLLLALLCTCALADTVEFDDFSAAVEIDGSKYTVLTRSNLTNQAEWLNAHGHTAESLLTKWKAEGVYLQAWSADESMLIQISAAQDDFAALYYDVNEITSDARKDYRLGHSSDKSGYWRTLGYDYTSADWKNYASIGRFLQLQYTRTVDGETYRGYARKTVRNGWHIHIDCQVHGRSLKTADKNALEAVMKDFEFTEIWPRPAVGGASSVMFSQKPPLETNTGKFTVGGSGTAGLKVTGVVMRMTANDADVYETTINKNGKFEIDVVLPQEGYWLMTYIVENNGTTVEEGVFEGTTFDKGLLPVTLNSDFPATMQLTGSSLVISGKTMAQTSVQCYVDGRYSKTIKTNNSGSFSFTIDTKEEGNYNIYLTFQKKGYDNRRFACNATRTYTEEDRHQIIRQDAVKPNYKTLNDKLYGYKGRYMVYTLYVESVEPSANGYLIFAGMTRTKSGLIKEKVVIRASEEPSFEAGAKVKMYLTCLGTTYEVVGDEGSSAYPYFDLQFTD